MATKSLKDRLLKKKPTEKKIDLVIDGEKLTITATALSGPQLQELRATYPPRASVDVEDGQEAGFNLDEYPPAYLALSVIDPVMSQDEWKEVWSSNAWSVSERVELWQQVYSLSFVGFDIPFGETP